MFEDLIKLSALRTLVSILIILSNLIMILFNCLNVFYWHHLKRAEIFTAHISKTE